MLFKVPQCTIRSTVQRSRLTARPPSRECTSSLSTKNQTGLRGRRSARLDIGSFPSTPWYHDRVQQLPLTRKNPRVNLHMTHFRPRRCAIIPTLESPNTSEEPHPTTGRRWFPVAVRPIPVVPDLGDGDPRPRSVAQGGLVMEDFLGR